LRRELVERTAQDLVASSLATAMSRGKTSM
jgi:hypothetical protein